MERERERQKERQIKKKYFKIKANITTVPFQPNPPNKKKGWVKNVIFIRYKLHRGAVLGGPLKKVHAKF